MRNKLSFSRFIESLGCPLRNPFYWSATSSDDKRVIFTIWSDQLVDGKYELWPNVTPLPEWTKRHGAKEWHRHMDVARAEGVEILGILCHVKDATANPRERDYYDEKSLLALVIEDTDEGAFARVVGEVSADDARRGPIRGHIQAQHDALNDLLDSVPEGVETPERQPSVGTGFRRDPMVRAYVLKRAKGRCEYCGEAGFLMANGQPYLEAHHILSLSANGPDKVSNVIALCPRHHREAHFGAEGEALNAKMQQIVQQ